MNNYLNKISDKKNEKNFLILIFCLFFLILAIRYLAIHHPLFLGSLPLAIDEAQYLAWSRELNFGYFSKPPFIAWILGLNLLIVDDIANINLRNLQPLAFAISAIFVCLSSLEITKKKSVAVWTGFLFFILPVSSFYSQFATTDAWLLLFWSISLFCLIKGINTDALKWWLLCGVFVGCGLLTKYSMVFFLISAFIYLLSQKKLISKKPWISFLLSIFIFSPNIIWNIQQKFPTVIHHAEMTNIDNRLLLSFEPVIEFFVGQFVIFGPLLFLLFLLISFGRFFSYFYLKSKNSILEMLFIFSWTILLFVLCLSFFGETEINWAAPASISICLLITTVVDQEQTKLSKKHRVGLNYIFTFSLVIHIFFLVCFIMGPKLFSYTDKSDDPNSNPFLQVRGYQSLMQIISNKTHNENNFLVVAEDRGILANMAIYLPPDKIRSWKKNSKIRHHWDLTQPLTDDDLKKQLLLVLKVSSLSNENAQNLSNELEIYFDNVHKINDVRINDIILQEKSNQKIMMFWSNKNKKRF